MEKIWVDIAELIGRVLARRWLLQQEQVNEKKRRTRQPQVSSEPGPLPTNEEEGGGTN